MKPLDAVVEAVPGPSMPLSEHPGNDPFRARELTLRLLLYFDIFDHPLTFQEIHTLGFPQGTARAPVVSALETLRDEGTLEALDGFYFLGGKAWSVRTRLEKAETSRHLWGKVPTASAILARFPFVRGALITGTLAKNAAGPDADIDFLVFTAPQRVWICRTFLAVFRKLLPERQREYLCTNVFMSEDALAYDQHNMYIAVEIALSHAALSPSLCARFVRENGWIRSYLPGFDPPKDADEPRLPRQGGLERVLQGPLGDWLELRLARAWQRFWARKYSELPPDELRRRFRVRPDLSTNHFHDFQAKTLQAYQERLERYGLASGR